ncbi:MAG: class I SAM-dependent methyltransferase [Bacteroidales bacterium]|nr:class I SAM-dependent methyltransferase [Bacteroidales bacterium]
MNGFDLKAQGWDENPVHLERSTAIAQAMIQALPLSPSMKALEFGAGTGILSFLLEDYVQEIVLVDTSIEMLKVCSQKMEQRNSRKLKTLAINLEDTTYTGEHVDLIFSQMALHHVKNIQAILQHFSSILNPGGYLVIADLYPEDGTFHSSAEEIHLGFEPRQLAKLMSNCGINYLSDNKVFSIKRNNEDSTKEFPVFLLIAQK